MELDFRRKIATNKNGYSYLNIPKAVASALGTKSVILRVKDDILEVIPQRTHKCRIVMQQKNIRARLPQTALGRNDIGIDMYNMAGCLYKYLGTKVMNPANLAGEQASISVEHGWAIVAVA